MCGINGYSFNQDDLIDRMNAVTKHRGPDGSGVFRDEHITLGHNSLAIVDTPANCRQPFASDDGNCQLIYNGEIYNYQKLREELIRQGEQFVTHTDTEVILKGLMRYGAEFLPKLDGMFALAFYNKKTSKLLLARDRAGIKPLYYHFMNGKFIFSSEIRGILESVSPVLDGEMMNLFFMFGYVPGERTLFQDIIKLLPAQVITVNFKNHDLDKSWYYQRETPTSKKISAEELRSLIGKAAVSNTMGLRPYGLYLSGGMDSAIILHELAKQEKNKIRTYTTRFETSNEDFNEDANLAARLCEDYNIEHHELLVTEKDFIAATNEAISTMEEPRYNHSVPAYWLLAQLASKDCVVMLNGSGGDELFLGYPRYLSGELISRRFKKYPNFLLDLTYSFKGLRQGFLSFGHLSHLHESLQLWAYVNLLNKKGLPGVRPSKKWDFSDAVAYLKESDAVAVAKPLRDVPNSMAEYDRFFWLANEEFLRTDKINMHFSMEGRFPFLSNSLIEWADSMPSRQKLHGGLKGFLRSAYSGQLPDYIIKKKKTGWTAPVTEWMDSEFGDMVREVLSPGYYPETGGLFDFELIRQRFLNKGRKNLRELKYIVPIFSFQIWAKSFKIQLTKHD